MLPDAIDDDAGGERMIGPREPVGQFLPPTTSLDDGCIRHGDNHWETARDEFAQPIIPTANVDLHIVETRLWRCPARRLPAPRWRLGPRRSWDRHIPPPTTRRFSQRRPVRASQSAEKFHV